ncbi:hypothetical protein CPLG_00138 [Cyanophage S-SSM2]|uniref:Uncharacterized protein n=2 Tax=Ahtivirus sagseatwo TaxID=2734079 RepID=A0A1D7SHT0_9CAUD|nr:hypothetical protein CPLG_00138 [Cyanophage S-SSM2]AOO13275.1 hypothetical protein LIS021110_161 [Cyanophage S-RIM14]AOO13491.1 hypothetical protein LIS110610_161 [Cyanophage S-RIM14]AOO13707.1 hypothetical protein Np111211_161 [Cyanophage S-RIM14]AOO13923.1 hypothetical protein Np450711_161 [Cyanophage S-RIM14]
MNTQTKFIVTYQKAFGFSVREEKEFDILEDAQWFSRAMKRAQFITNILEVKS